MTGASGFLLSWVIAVASQPAPAPGTHRPLALVSAWSIAALIVLVLAGVLAVIHSIKHPPLEKRHVEEIRASQDETRSGLERTEEKIDAISTFLGVGPQGPTFGPSQPEEPMITLVRLKCDVCSNTVEVSMGSLAQTFHAMRAEAKARGWNVRPVDNGRKDLCPECSERWKRLQQR